MCFLWQKLSSKDRQIQVVITDVEPKKLSGFSVLLRKVRGDHRTLIIAHSSFYLNHT